MYLDVFPFISRMLEIPHYSCIKIDSAGKNLFHKASKTDKYFYIQTITMYFSIKLN